MAELSKAAKTRLGIFLLIAVALTAFSLVALIGSAMLEERDAYTIYFDGSVNGLEPGSAVKYNGIQVGRVEELRVDPNDVTRIRAEVTLTGGTPIKADTVAILSLQGITGQMYVELSGGTNQAATLEPGATIASKPSRLGALLEKADEIATKLDSLVDNLVSLTSEENARQVEATLREVRGISENVRQLAASVTPRVESILANVDESTREVTELVRDGRLMVSQVSQGVERVSSWVDPSLVARVLSGARDVLDVLERRLGSKELGAALAAYTELAHEGRALAGAANLTLVRAKDDLLRALDELVNGAEAFAEFAAILRDDPAALIRGRSAAERELE